MNQVNTYVQMVEEAILIYFVCFDLNKNIKCLQLYYLSNLILNPYKRNLINKRQSINKKKTIEEAFLNF
jgi:hypothetical protein